MDAKSAESKTAPTVATEEAVQLTVVGMNSLFVYCVGEILRGWIDHSVMVFSGGFNFVGTLAPVAQSCAVLLVVWYLAYWLYKRKIFLKV